MVSVDVARKVLTGMERKYLVRRDVSPYNRNVLITSLTDHGRDTFEAVYRIYDNEVKKYFKEVSTNDLVTCRDLFHQSLQVIA